MGETLTPDWAGALRRARAHSPFLARALDRQPDLAALLEAGEGAAALAWARTQSQHPDAEIALRRERLALAAALAVGDLAGAFPLAQVVHELTAFADRALDTAIRTAITERTDLDSADGFIALALGKQGAGELNYSSDIDPVLLFDRDRLPRRASDDPGEAAQRYARRVVALLAANTADGYALRVDLRLRPASEINPLCVPVGAALTHYQGAALAWERAAFTRARAAAGDIAAGEAFLAQIRPFVWRSQLDFGAIEEISALTMRIRDSHAGPPLPGPGFDVKRGRGGIREIEFYAQTHQLIHGGRDVSLRVRGTRAGLDALAAAGWIDAENARVLGEGYDRLRAIEHRLQMVHDRQTHALPEGEALDNVARLDGLADGAALVAELTDLTTRTGRIYEELIGRSAAAPVAVAMPTSRLARQLGDWGLAEPEVLAERIETWRDGRHAAIRSPQAIEAWDRLAPALLEAIAHSDDPMRAITRWERIIESVPSAITTFRLLDARPDLTRRLVAALTLAPVLSDELARKPELLDTLIDRDALELPGEVPAIMARMRGAAVREDYEALLDAIRIVTGEIRFALGIQLIEGLADPLAIARALSRTAEAALQLATDATVAEFTAKHGRIGASELLILGLGRLGGGALTHASDLDLVYLFTGDFAAQSDGPRPLGGTIYYNRLASRVSAALSVPTAQGALYEVDTRLRPQGNQGPLAVSCEAFGKYQREAAWTWEHMALARARVLYGSAAARAQLEAVLAEVLHARRDRAALREAVLGMRAEMAKHKPQAGPVDAKLARGGLVDIEFLVHYLQLKGETADGSPLAETAPEALSPDLEQALAGLAAAGLVPADLAEPHGLMSRMLVAGRLLAPDGREPPPSGARALARACGCDSYAALLEAFAAARARVAQVWKQILGTDILAHEQENPA
ncbi:bifunctional [glutamate--ammonia ligase]-adenylyl-L-tyrosine phosphorylase/[glutamate--ammonia-ligase] adenylyltransferase [Erythrobacter sp. BLCC-B19]|uniref:bifunctional [glutamate--ammonia ligase]-adenylyl-L-tyrosine phosphorylase/[glutamate--ammonia-ligase] adenylyltransferase n=1 Tax=Erythrobacter sp. BLCC-B19 TaxID=3025315 RepID=UPI00235E0E98|nr:bifunctional [glutamate--ammonia ligase]-adenylyl-L-tyrosine phosphorylase/[glutamate--ammonia-ligase] adenylyltransferase [Erythrobacter sp. BLCC-B19]WDA42253.1 bifunctional [glutamate--ammonia ligase]-adenylyl-L-tyrosine phosphorylase/[glutamate--ammonia-ligase] adenylyltransferase [Erythrobacter sp. BLCC-B19]